MKENNSDQHIFGAHAPFNKEDVCRELGISRRTLGNWMSRRILPYYKIGALVFFNPSEIAKAMSHRRISAKCEEVANGSA